MTGPLSERLYKLDEINRRERETADRRSDAFVEWCLVLAIFIVLAAIVRSITQ